MLRRLALAAALSLCVAGAAVAQDQPNIRIEFDTVGIDDPAWAPFWTDHVDEISPDSAVVPRIFVSQMPTSNGGTFAVTMFAGGGSCGIGYCDVRVIENGAVIADFPACSEPTAYELSADGTTLLACGEAFNIGEIAEWQKDPTSTEAPVQAN